MAEDRPVRVRADAARRAERAWNARLRGLEWSVVAVEVGYSSASTACRSVSRWRQSLHRGTDSSELLDAMREESLGVLMYTRGKCLEALDDGRAGAARDVIACEARIAQLGGLDAPNELIVHSPTQSEIDQWVATMVVEATPFLQLEQADVVDV